MTARPILFSSAMVRAIVAGTKTVVVVAVLVVGCANVTTTTIRRLSNGTVVIDSGKDVTFDAMIWREGPTYVEVRNYSSNVNAEAIKAQDARERAVRNDAIQAVKAGVTFGMEAARKGVVP